MGNNKKKTTNPTITMKFFAAAVLRLKEEDKPATHDDHHDGEEGGYPFEEPKCDEDDKPDTEGWEPIDYFMAADTDGSQTLSAEEGFKALFCAAKWGEMKEEEAEWLFHFLGKRANTDENGVPDELDVSEAKEAFKVIEEWKKENEQRKKDGKREFPFPAPKCPEKPEEEPTLEEAFDMIDADGSGALDAEEGFEALYCMVGWELISGEQAFAIYDHAASHAGDDGEVDLGEMGAAMEEVENATEEEIAAKVDGANMTTE